MLGHMHIYFIYLSHLNLWGTMFMTGLSAYLVTSYHYDLLQVESHMPQLLKLHWFLWNQSTAFSCTISLFYWSDRNETVPIDLNDILVHSTNSAILFIELLVVKHPPNFWNWLIFVPIECTFLVFTVIFQYSDGLEKWESIPSPCQLDFSISLSSQRRPQLRLPSAGLEEGQNWGCFLLLARAVEFNIFLLDRQSHSQR